MPVSPGTSRAPVINMNGEVIGIVSGEIIGGDNMGYAVPVNLLKPLIEPVEQIAQE